MPICLEFRILPSANGMLIQLYQAFWLLAGLLGIAMTLGTWLARQVIERIPRGAFQRYVAGLLAAIALYMLRHG